MLKNEYFDEGFLGLLDENDDVPDTDDIDFDAEELKNYLKRYKGKLKRLYIAS